MPRRQNAPAAFLLARTSGAGPDAASVIQRSRPFAAGLAAIGSATLLAVRGADGIGSWLIAPDGPRSESVAGNLAAAVGAQARRAAAPPALGGPAVCWAAARPARSASRDTQQGGDPAEVARLLGREMAPGSWVAATVRRATRREVERTRRWYDYRLGGAQTHHSKEGEPLVASFLAGAADADAAAALLSALLASLPGFDIEFEVRAGSALGRAAGIGALALLGPAAGSGAAMAGAPAALALAAALPPAALALGYASRRVPTRADAARAQRDSLAFRPAPRLLRPPKPPRREGAGKPGGKPVPASPGGYPLHPSGFLVGSSVVVGVAAPYAGAASGISAAAAGGAPPALLGDIGPYVGDAGGRRVRISAADQIEGVGIFGLPGRGKSVLVQNLFAADVLERVRPSGKPGRCGAENALVAFENKGAGARGYMDWIMELGDACVFVDLADPSTPAIDLLAVPGTAGQRADFLANMMQYVFGKQAVGDQSMNTLKSVFHAAFLLPPELASAAVEGGFDAHPLAIGHGLLSGYGDEEGERLAAAYAAWAKSLDPASPERAEAVRAGRKLSLLYGPKVTPAQRRALTSAPISKTGLLAGADFWWSPGRARTTWRDILEGHWAAVVNTGSSESGAAVGADLTAAFSAMLAYTLRDSVQRYCGGWQDAGRHVTVYADELSLLAGSTAEVIAWMRNQARSYGLRPVLATQYPDQLAPEVLAAVMSFSTFFWFAQNSAKIKADAVADLGGEAGGYTPDDIGNLAPYRAIMRTVVGKQGQPPVAVAVAYWGPDADRPAGRAGEFAADQGCAGGPQAPPGVRAGAPAGEVPDGSPAGPFAAFEGR